MPPNAPFPAIDRDHVRPNIIWFMVDQMRAQAMACAGDPNVSTPNLDRMACRGVHFVNAVSGFPLCCPARASFVTGLYPHQCGVRGHEWPLDPCHRTAADLFTAAGYHTAWFGKWHLDGYKEREGRAAWHTVPRDHRGRFATWLGYENNNSPWDSWVHGHRGGEEVLHRRLPGFETAALTDLLMEEVDAHRERPFFACVSVQPPHDPYAAPAEAMARYLPAALTLRPNVPPVSRVEERARRQLAGYYALIEDVDRQLGRLQAFLEERQLAERTFVVFVSDHGDQFGSHGHFLKMTPYDEAIRVPLIVHGGHRWIYRMERRPVAPFNHVDLLPTSLGLARLQAPDDLPGCDYSHHVWGGAPRRPEPDSAYLQSTVPTGHGDSCDLPWRGLVTSDGWKYVALEGAPWMLFDRTEDPYELVNLAQQAHARDRRQAMNARLARWIAETGDDFRLP